jgi:polyisoprenoid-binding protein YceI
VSASATIGLLAFSLLAGAAAQAPVYRVDGSLTEAGFAINYLGVLKQRGRFERVWGTIVLDPAAGAGSVEFTLDGASVTTGWDVRDDFIRGENMFDVTRFPLLRFRSIRLAYDAAVLRAVEGEFTLRGVTRPLLLDVRELRCAPAAPARERCQARVLGRISRAEFGMTYGAPLIGDEVELDFVVTAVRVRDEGETGPP